METPLSAELIAKSNSGNKKTPVEKNFVTSLNKFLNLKYANMLGVLPQVITNDLLYSFIDEWYGTRYRFGGTDKSGIDCSAFVQRLYARVFNIGLFRTAAEQFKVCHSIWNKEELNEGDKIVNEDGSITIVRKSGKILGIPKTAFWIGVSAIALIGGFLVYKKFIAKK
jgi:hypothetical protein